MSLPVGGAADSNGRCSGALVAKLVHGDGGVLGVGVADVEVAVVLGDEVDVVEEEAVPVFLPHRLSEANVHQLGPVEGVIPRLRRKNTQNTQNLTEKL